MTPVATDDHPEPSVIVLAAHQSTGTPDVETGWPMCSCMAVCPDAPFGTVAAAENFAQHQLDVLNELGFYVGRVK